MTPKREDRLNPMSRRRGRPPAPPPGPEWMVLAITVSCGECDWTGLDLDEPSAVGAWRKHARLRHPDLSTDSFTVKEEQ